MVYTTYLYFMVKLGMGLLLLYQHYVALSDNIGKKTFLSLGDHIKTFDRDPFFGLYPIFRNHIPSCKM